MSPPGRLKGKQTLSHLRASSSFTLALQCCRFSPGFPESCTISNYRAFLHSEYFPECTNQTPKAEAICSDPQRISEATNKRAPRSYLNKGSIVSMASITIFNRHDFLFHVAVLLCYVKPSSSIITPAPIIFNNGGIVWWELVGAVGVCARYRGEGLVIHGGYR